MDSDDIRLTEAHTRTLRVVFMYTLFYVMQLQLKGIEGILAGKKVYYCCRYATSPFTRRS